MVNREGLLKHLAERPSEKVALLSQQALGTDRLLARALGARFTALFSPEHGWYGLAAPGEKTAGEMHPRWHLPVHSLYGETRRPTPDMLAGLDRIVIDLQDLGARCYTYLATTKLMLEACAEAHIAVTVLDRPIPLGGIVDGPRREAAFESFVAPLDIPLCHGMTPGEYATYIQCLEHLEVDLTVVRLTDWTHRTREPWVDFVPPSPGIRTWDSAALYPATLFTEAYTAVDCDRAGPYSFRVLGAPWFDAEAILAEEETAVAACGVGLRPYRYRPEKGAYAGETLDGLLLSVVDVAAFRPVQAGVRLFAAIGRHHPQELAVKGRPEWFDKLFGSSATREAVEKGDWPTHLDRWSAVHTVYRSERVDLYA